MDRKNRLNRIVSRVDSLPESLRSFVLSIVMGKTIPFAGKSGIKVELLTESKSVIRLKNRRKVQNHIHGIHAAAMALLAESATGFICGMNIPDDKALVIKTLKVDFLKRATGDLKAEAYLTREQIEQIKTLEKGSVAVAIEVTDEKGIEPIQCEMVWAWTPRRR
jgi:acyl-coenzyme A thioesterase PaaI-like protein